MRRYDHIVVGHGLAGAVLAARLRENTHRVLIVDQQRPSSASSVAAGLITPVTGRRLALVPNWHDLITEARAFYGRLQHAASTRLLSPQKALRLFQDETERERFRARADLLAGAARERELVFESNAIEARYGGFEMPDAARVDTNALLSVCRELAGDHHVATDGAVRHIEHNDDGVVVPELNVAAKHLTFCEGYSAEPNPWFPELTFEAVKGETLTLRIPGLNEHRTIHAHGIWLTRIDEDTYRTGATYDRENLDCETTPAAAEDLVERLRQFLSADFEIIDQLAGVRPVLSHRAPVVGVHPRYDRIGCFNGLGSHGALLAPLVARTYVSHLDAGDAVDPQYDLSRLRRPRGRGSLTDQVHRLLEEHVRAGDTVVDATAGNGHDTVALAKMVGAAGHVIAMDIQQRAIDSTARRLQREQAHNVRLVRACHSELARYLEPATSVSAVVFNLGYLPGGDRAVVTRPELTCTAVEQAYARLHAGGVVSVLAYVGHPGGAVEADAAEAALDALPDRRWLRRDETVSGSASPRILVVQKPRR